MILILLLALSSFNQSASSPLPKPGDAALTASIERLFHDMVTTDDPEKNKLLRSELKKLYSTHGLPSVSEVGDEAAYKFVVLLATGDGSSASSTDISRKVKDAAAGGEIPMDAARFFDARMRIEKSKEAARQLSPKNPELRDEIERLYKEDQAVREQAGFDVAKMTAMDLRNAQPLQAMLDKFGVPTYSLVGPTAAGHFVIMIQHQPPEFRERVLPSLKANVDAGQADPDGFAKVYDRSQRDLGRKQYYGEDMVCAAGESLHSSPIEDAAHVNQRRAELGLLRIEVLVPMAREAMPQFCPPANNKL